LNCVVKKTAYPVEQHLEEVKIKRGSWKSEQPEMEIDNPVSLKKAAYMGEGRVMSVWQTIPPTPGLSVPLFYRPYGQMEIWFHRYLRDHLTGNFLRSISPNVSHHLLKRAMLL
jgi:hypothetical protein